MFLLTLVVKYPFVLLTLPALAELLLCYSLALHYNFLFEQTGSQECILNHFPFRKFVTFMLS